MKSRKKRAKNHYFTKDTEAAIINYCNTQNLQERSKLYVDHIQPAFNELVDKIRAQRQESDEEIRLNSF